MRLINAIGIYDKFEIDAFEGQTFCKIRFDFHKNSGWLVIENIPNTTNLIGIQDHKSILEKVVHHFLSKKILVPSKANNIVPASDKFEDFIIRAGVQFLLNHVDLFVYFPSTDDIPDSNVIAQIRTHDDGSAYLSYCSNIDIKSTKKLKEDLEKKFGQYWSMNDRDHNTEVQGNHQYEAIF
jgi:hypothetical protein